MDRDEARFATASKTMLIDKDFIDIKMVEEKDIKSQSVFIGQTLMNSIFEVIRMIKFRYIDFFIRSFY